METHKSFVYNLSRRRGQSNTLHFARVVCTCMWGEVGENRNSRVTYFGMGGTSNAAVKGHSYYTDILMFQILIEM